MDEHNIKRLLRRFRREDFLYVVKNWSPIVSLRSSRLRDDTGFISQINKVVFADAVWKEIKGKKLKKAVEAHLDILYVQKYSRSRLWTVYKLVHLPDAARESIQNPTEFESNLREQLTVYFDSEVDLQTHGETWWIRICILEGPVSKVARPSPTFIVMHPHTDYFLVANMKVSHSKYILQALVLLLQGHKVEPLPLKGRCLPSLVQLVLNKHSQGTFSEYRLNQVDGNPLGQRKRKRQEIEEDNEMDPDIVFENVSEKRQRQEVLRETFGPNVQPTLEKVEYQMETKFKGTEFAPGMAQRDSLFKCRVRFEGSNVLEGIRSLGAAGLAELPMPAHLAKIHSMGKNYFLLRQKPDRT